MVFAFDFSKTRKSSQKVENSTALSDFLNGYTPVSLYSRYSLCLNKKLCCVEKIFKLKKIYKLCCAPKLCESQKKYVVATTKIM